MRIVAVCVLLGIVACGEDNTGAVIETEVADTGGLFEIVDLDTSILAPETETETSEPEVVVIEVDTSTPDAETAVAQPGEFGTPCSGNIECNSGYCVEGPDGYVCTRLCSETCPADFDCKGVAGENDVVFLCMPRTDKNCTPCRDDLQCNGGTCMEIEGDLRCADSCTTRDDCPTSFDCRDERCVPTTGSCTCYGAFDGGLRTCRVSNAVGTCYGVESCNPASGWNGCDAKTPVVETCNGQDDDCDAFVDEGLDEVGRACQVTVGGVGSCPGTTVCAGLGGLQCQGPTPTPETCNFEDDNCDGQVDEDFKTGAVYSKFEHCGTCNRSCAIGFPNAAQTTCQVQQGVAQCVVVSCQPGFIKQNDFQCIPDIVNLCEPCSEDANCLGQGSACVTLSDGSFCAKACSDANPTACPVGYSCQTVAGEASKQCLPTTGVCSCGQATLGLSRACSVTVAPAGQPSTTCAGSETCGGAGWSSCVLPVETCNGFDDNCDGVVDDGFRNAAGKYDRVENCGACGVSCLALNFANASPTCNSGGTGAPQCGYQCNSGWVDIDELPGCECRPTSTTDLPDPDGIDANCDGIDGEIGKSVFVAKTGNDAGLGTIDDPLRTVQAGITRAGSQGKRDVLVATGVYVESVTLANKVNVYGGYAPDFHARDRFTHESAILAVDPTDTLRGAVNARNIATTAADALKFDGFTVFGADTFVAGGNSYTVYLRDVGPHFTLSNNDIIAGNGGGGSAGQKGVDGTGGVTGRIGVGAASVTTCSAANHASGGSGGATSCEGIDVSGGDGGKRVCPVAPANVQTGIQTPGPEEQGASGRNNDASFGSGGISGWDDKVQNSTCSIVSSSNTADSFGAGGGDGRRGVNGSPGATCVSGVGGVDTDGQWLAPTLSTGSEASHGGGGGGGGAAGGIDHRTDCVSGNPPQAPVIPPYVVGGSGGGGGSGGCRGRPGVNGTSGGGSFAIFLTYSTAPVGLPSIANNTIIRARGGAGGAGGAGGVGGAGGFGAAGGGSGRGAGGFPQSCCGSSGGAGGNGGAGGHGSGGNGGCGGPSYGIYIAPVALGLPRTAFTGNTLSTSGAGGTGGAGGTSLGLSGSAGGVGLNAATNY